MRTYPRFILGDVFPKKKIKSYRPFVYIQFSYVFTSQAHVSGGRRVQTLNTPLDTALSLGYIFITESTVINA
jgi:hypothetical protein